MKTVAERGLVKEGSGHGSISTGKDKKRKAVSIKSRRCWNW